jgi:alanine racemase
MSDEIAELIDFLTNTDRVNVKSVYSHLAASDDPDSDEFTLSQVSLFKTNADRLSDALGYKPMYHILNSAGIERCGGRRAGSGTAPEGYEERTAFPQR